MPDEKTSTQTDAERDAEALFEDVPQLHDPLGVAAAIGCVIAFTVALVRLLLP